MSKERVLVFEPYPFEVGDKIHIESGHRRGDWLVIGTDEKKVRLRCPVSLRELEWDKFCYFVERRENEEWPRH